MRIVPAYPSSSSARPTISEIISSHRPDLADYEALYKHLHAHPELSFQEAATAATIASRLHAIDPSISVSTGIGGHGVVGVLRAGAAAAGGATVLLRADMDGLPVLERTGLGYASRARQVDGADGVSKPVMHACGHDMHVASLLAATALMAAAGAAGCWAGALVVLFQPAEERGAGARAMVDDGLYDRVPVPDVVLGGHVMPYRAGWIGTKRGLMASAADSKRVTLYGRGGHASQPQRLIDPVLMAASAVVRLQSIVAREVDPADSAVVTVGSIAAGEAENVVSDTATMKLNVRTINPETRKKVLESVERIVKAESWASNGTKEPLFEDTSNFPFTFNDDEVTEELERGFAAHFGEDEKRYTRHAPRLSGSEDFGILATAINRPSSFWIYGGTDPELWDKSEKEGRLTEDVPINHSSSFAPVIMPTLKVAVDAYAVAALTWLAKK
ncbi:hypothetical protein MBLNU459_g3991t1 [Dothideomycetes sp. NU459]